MQVARSIRQSTLLSDGLPVVPTVSTSRDGSHAAGDVNGFAVSSCLIPLKVIHRQRLPQTKLFHVRTAAAFLGKNRGETSQDENHPMKYDVISADSHINEPRNLDRACTGQVQGHRPRRCSHFRLGRGLEISG